MPVPVLVDEPPPDVGSAGAGVRIRAHVAKANPLRRSAPCPALLPSWTDELVHVHGALRVQNDPEWLEGFVRELTDRHEANLPAPWSVDDAPAEFVQRMLRAIVGIELVVHRVEAKRTLSQHRDHADATGVVAGLRARGDRRAALVADAMAEVLGPTGD